MFNFFKNKRGYTLVEVIVAVTLITTLVASYVNLFNGMLTSTTYFRDNMTAQMLAANRWKELDLTAYASLTSETKAAVGTTGFEREVILGSDIDLGGGNHKRDVTINVYKTGNATALFSAPKVVTSQGTGGSVPSGTIVIWAGPVASIPAGWKFCDGTNGTPDLRSRFVYGAGSDVNTKIDWADGWNNVNGHWPPWWTGGEETHVLTIAEMPSHNHLEGANGPTTIIRDWGYGLIYNSTKKTAKTSDDSWATYHPYTQATGGSQRHNVMPRFMTLAYIMKL